MTLRTWIVAACALSGVVLAFQKASVPPSPRELARELRGAWPTAGAGSNRAFRDATLDWGLASFHENGASGGYWFPEPLGPGVALFDLDGDEDLDLFLTGGGALGPHGSPQACELWLNEGGRLVLLGPEAGAAVPGPAYGVACGDVDGDGDVDLAVTRLGSDVLLINEGGRLRDASAEYGLVGEDWGMSATFLDYDRDGHLDLYVTNYLVWSPEQEQECLKHGKRDYCVPTVFPAARDRLYRNIAGQRLEDVSDSAGITLVPGNGLGVVAEDFDEDGWLDLYVANDLTPGILWINQGDGTFIDRALEWGCAYDGAGVSISGMGIACENFIGNDGWDLLVTNIESHLALSGEGNRFVDVTRRTGVHSWSFPSTGFGIALFDQDHDTALDLYVTNGAVNLTGPDVDPEDPYSELDHFARWVDGKWMDASAGAGLPGRAAGRGTARGDMDGDGDLDLVLTNNGGSAVLLENQHDGKDDWLIVDVRTEAGAPALGARVRVTLGERRILRSVRAGGSYLSSHDPRVHLGLGDVSRVDGIEVEWPDGRVRSFESVPGGQVLEVRP